MNLIAESEAKDFTVWHTITGSHHGQMDGYCQAETRPGGMAIGYLDFSVFEGRARIKMIEVSDEWKRKGVASALIDCLAKDMKGYEHIDWGYTTPEGESLRVGYEARQSVTEDENASSDLGMIVRATKGDDFDEVNHFFVKTWNGYRRVAQQGRFFGLMPEHVEYIDDYRSVATVVPAPQPGEKLRASVQMIGFPEGTTFKTASGKVVTVVGDQAEFEGKRYDLKFVEDVSLDA